MITNLHSLVFKQT